MSDEQPQSEDATQAATDGQSAPAHGNLFKQPRLTALDPIDAAERKETERLLETAGAEGS